MGSTRQADPSQAADPSTDDELLKLGITRVSIDYFHVGEFRYTSLADALAEARRRSPGVMAP